MSKNRTPREEEPSWEAPEHRGEPADDVFEIKNPHLAALFHWVMISFLLSLVFLISGGLLWLLLNSGRTPELFWAESAKVGWGQFIIGGVIGVAALVLRYFEPLKKDRI